MKHPFHLSWGSAFLGAVVFVFFSNSIRAGEPAGRFKVLDDFSDSTVGDFPRKWKPARRRGREIYRVLEEAGNLFVRADVKDDSVNIGLDIPYSIQEYPYLCWRWRVHRYPAGKDAGFRKDHDCAAGVYVLIRNRLSLLPRYIKYIWSRTLPPGKRFFYKKNRAIVVLQSGASSGKEGWVWETPNVLDDFRHFYGEHEYPILGISILSDSDATRSRACADYDDFTIRSRPRENGETRSASGRNGTRGGAS